MTQYDEAILRVTREFSEGLPARIGILRETLLVLAAGYEHAAAERFHLPAHALHGTAASVGADAVAGSARLLADFGKRWRAERLVLDDEQRAAAEALEQLERAVSEFRRRVEG